MKITLESLQILDAIDRRGSFAAAAEEVFRVPSALTYSMQKLESDLGVALFDRSGRRALLTAAGRALLEEGRVLLQAADALECRVKRIATGWETELRIALDVVLDVAALFPLIETFYAQMSGTRLRLSHEVLGGSWDALATNRADLVIGVSGDHPPGGGYATHKIGDAEFVFAVAPGHPLATVDQPIAAHELLKHRAVAIADTSRRLSTRSSGLLDGQDVLTVPDMAAKLAAQIAGLGAGFLPCAMAEREAVAGRLVICEVVESKPPIPLYLAWRTRDTGRALRWFQKQLEDATLAAALLRNLVPQR
ncbi:MAG TPA: LysR family transcriptional regulator [Sulfuriferula sp.]|nr:LysR family transcriptional regulator [Sulfuriferula sp.]